MQNNNILKKSLVVGIILLSLFVGVSIVSAFIVNNVTESKSISSDNRGNTLAEMEQVIIQLFKVL